VFCQLKDPNNHQVTRQWQLGSQPQQSYPASVEVLEGEAVRLPLLYKDASVNQFALLQISMLSLA